MEKKTILLLHGFASSGQSTKAQYLKEKFRALPQVEFRALDFNPTPRDFEFMTVTGMVNRLRQYALDHHLQSVSLIGSSLGALVGLHYAFRFGGVEKMLLLAPGLSWLSGGLSETELEQWEKAGTAPVFHYAFEKALPVRYDLHVDGLCYLEPIPPTTPITIIHGQNDDVVPIDNSRKYAVNFPDKVRLIEVDAAHTLNNLLPFIWEHVRSFLCKRSDLRGFGRNLA